MKEAAEESVRVADQLRRDGQRSSMEHLTVLGKFVEKCTPSNVLALIEEVERQAREINGLRRTLRRTVGRLEEERVGINRVV
jgi:hypothetical protein